MSAPPPVLLVHGFLATRSLLWPMRRRIERTGRGVFTVPLSPLVVQDVRRLAAELDAGVERVRDQLGADRVDLVGVSQGGVLALWWAHHLGGFARTRRLLLVGAPVRGTWAAAVGLPLLGAVSRGIWQLVPGAPLLRELDRPLPPGARVHTLAMEGDPVSPEARCRVAGAPHETFPAGFGPLTHQYLVLSRPVADRVSAILDET
jgi:pimeloyl-ACP methyl ester carboxylesterase